MNIQTSNSSVKFTIKKLLFITVKGAFSEVSGTIDLNTEEISNSKIDLVISVANLDTGNKKRNEHLQQDDFFKTANHPTITFSSSEIVKKNEFYWAKGTLSVAGTTDTIEIPFQVKDNKVTGEFSLNRMDYKVGKVPAFVAAKMVNVTFKLDLV